MNVFTQAEMDWLRELGSKASGSGKKAEKVDLLKGMTGEQTSLLMDWMMYRMTGKRPSAESRENGKVSARVGRSAAARKIQKGTV